MENDAFDWSVVTDNLVSAASAGRSPRVCAHFVRSEINPVLHAGPVKSGTSGVPMF